MAISMQFSRFSVRTDLSLPENRLFWCRKSSIVRCSAAGEAAASQSSSTVESEFDAKVFRHNLTRSKNYNRKGFGHKEETLELMNREYTSDIIKKLKENGYDQVDEQDVPEFRLDRDRRPKLELLKVLFTNITLCEVDFFLKILEKEKEKYLLADQDMKHPKFATRPINLWTLFLFLGDSMVVIALILYGLTSISVIVKPRIF